MSNRIIGIDVARALALIGMIIVNFKLVIGSVGDSFLNNIAQFFEGKAAATFVFLAGLGIGLVNKKIEGREFYKIIIKRAIFLFILGMSYYFIWPADILHFYAIYMLVLLSLIQFKRQYLLVISTIMVLSYPLLMLFIDYETAWNFTTLHYSDFWTINGFLRNLFYNGFHPVLPWASFMLLGYWFSKLNLDNLQTIKRSAIISFIIYLVTALISFSFVKIFNGLADNEIKELSQLFATSPMPPLPLYMISASAFALFVVSSCIMLSEKYPGSFIVKSMKKTGTMALSFYVAHVVLGMGIIESIAPEMLGKYSIEFSVLYALVFSLFCILFANIWLMKYKYGPIEWLMKKIL